MKAAAEASDYTDGHESSTKVWTGTEGLGQWNELVFYPESYGEVKSLVAEAVKEQAAAAEGGEEGFEEGPAKMLSKKTTDLLAGIMEILEFMGRRDAVYRDDYRMAVVKAQGRRKGPVEGKKGWVGRGDKGAIATTITLNFWCLNPGVCFDDLKQETRAIVLTSGTLSPMATFASELDVRFPISLEAAHVIDKSQVWVGSLAAGPTGYSLNAAYKNANTFQFQDEVGRMVVEVCRTIPHGILVFLPSYKMLNLLTERWQATGAWGQLTQLKHVVSEPKGNDRLDEAMKEFYGVVEETSRSGVTELGQSGALFLAVCRGKVSEGMDFADNNARAVVCVGIPFPNVKDTLVDLKKRYNDKRRSGDRESSLLSGGEWYEIQAFRALNQALGRCIRHRNDWGAILMVDDRYIRNQRYVGSLSKWVRGKVVHYAQCPPMLASLATFARDMKHFQEERRVVEEEERSKRKAKKEEEGKENRAAATDQGGEQTGGGRSSEYFKPGSGGGSTAWDSHLATTAAKLAAARSQSLLEARKEAAGVKEREKEELAAERRDRLVNLDTQRNLNGGLSASSLLAGLPQSFAASKPMVKVQPRRKEERSLESTSASSVVSTSSSPFSASPSTVVVVEASQPSKKARKMDFVSSDEEEEAAGKAKVQAKPRSRDNISILNKPSIQEKPSIKEKPSIEVKPILQEKTSNQGKPNIQGKPSIQGNASLARSSVAARLEQFRHRPKPPAVSLGEAVKRKKSESPECDFDLNFEDDMDFEEAGDVVQLNYEKPKPQKKPLSCGDGWLGTSRVKPTVISKPTIISKPTVISKLPVTSKPEDEMYFGLDEEFEFEEEAGAVVAPGLSSLQQRPSSFSSLTAPRGQTVSSLTAPRGQTSLPPTDPPCPPSPLYVAAGDLGTSRDPYSTGDTRQVFDPLDSLEVVERQDSEEKVLLEQMMKRRQRMSGGGGRVTPEAVEEVTVIPETPDLDLDMGSDFDEVEPSKPALQVAPSKPALKQRKPALQPCKPALLVEPIKPALQMEPSKPGYHLEPSKPALQKPSIPGQLLGSSRKPLFRAGGLGRWASEEEVEVPQQAKPSLSSADEIEEPEEVVRKVVRKPKRSRLSSAKKARRKEAGPGAGVNRVVDSDDDDFL